MSMSIEKIVTGYVLMGSITAFIILNMNAVPDVNERKRRYKIDSEDIGWTVFSFLLWPIMLPIIAVIVLETAMDEICLKHDWHPWEWLFLWPLKIMDIVADRREKRKEESR